MKILSNPTDFRWSCVIAVCKGETGSSNGRLHETSGVSQALLEAAPTQA